MAERYHTIGLPQSEYEKLSQAKAFYEADTSQKLDWGKFLVVLAMAYFIGKGLQQQASQQDKGGNEGEGNRSRIH